MKKRRREESPWPNLTVETFADLSVAALCLWVAADNSHPRDDLHALAPWCLGLAIVFFIRLLLDLRAIFRKRRLEQSMGSIPGEREEGSLPKQILEMWIQERVRLSLAYLAFSLLAGLLVIGADLYVLSFYVEQYGFASISVLQMLAAVLFLFELVLNSIAMVRKRRAQKGQAA